MSLAPPPAVLLEPAVRAALVEDMGRAGDVTSQALVPADASARFAVVAREPGVLAGLPAARSAFALVDPAVCVTTAVDDGERVDAGRQVAVIEGPARSILTAERVALNFLGHLSGVATATAGIADAIAHTAARVCCTRKTTPGLRMLEKYAVRAGGGVNHRFGLDDAMLVKDNHIAVAGGVSAAIERAKRAAGHLMPIEVEVDSLDQLAQVLDDPVSAVLLDNFSPDEAALAVAMVGGAMTVEASGRLTAALALPLAETGVDLLSAGWITHSAPVLDLGLDEA